MPESDTETESDRLIEPLIGGDKNSKIDLETVVTEVPKELEME